jgi:hypothetical protein
MNPVAAHVNVSNPATAPVSDPAATHVNASDLAAPVHLILHQSM